MAVIKICDGSLIDGEDGASLFDDDVVDDNKNHKIQKDPDPCENDLTVSILVLNSIY